MSPVSPGDDSKTPGVEDSNYIEGASSTFIEMPTTSSTSSGLPTTTSNHTNVTSLHSLTHTDEGLSREGDESDAGSEIYQAFGILPDTGRPESAAGDLYYTRRLYDGDTDYKLYNNEERLYIVSENLGESEKVPVRSNSYMFRGGDLPRNSQSSGNNGWKNSNGANSNGWKGVPPSRQNSVGPSTNRRDASHKATVLPPLHKAKPGQGSYREPACFPIFRWCLSLLGLAMLLVVVVILGQLLTDFDLAHEVEPVEASIEANL